MPFLKIPLDDLSNASNWHLKYIEQSMEDINAIDSAKTAPLLRLLEIFQQGISHGCSVTLLDKNRTLAPKKSSPQASIIYYLQGLVQDKVEDEIQVFDEQTGISYLSLSLKNFPGGSPKHFLILWRDSMFSPNDICTIKILVSVLSDKYSAKEVDLFSTSLWSSNALGLIPTTESIEHNFMLRTALDTVKQSVLVCSREGVILEMNTAGNLLLKNVSFEMRTTQGKGWLAGLCHPDDLKTLFSSWTESDEKHRTLECRLQTQDSIFTRFEITLVPVDYCQESFKYWIIIISNKKTISEEVDDTNRYKGRFLAEISHEIRTPLACVLGTSTLLSHTKLDLDQQEMLRTIAVSSQQLSNLISNVLDMSRIDENKLVVESIAILLEKTVLDVVELFRAEFCRKLVDPLIEIDSNVPKWILSDELRLKQILTNLLSNALKFCRSDSVIIVSLHSTISQGRRFLEFCVEDEGVGLSEAAISRLFESFNQLDVSTARKFGGSGLGLVICKKLAELLGGRIWCKSEVGVGTKFSFLISCQEPTEIQTAAIPKIPFNCLNSKLVKLQNVAKTCPLDKYLFCYSFKHPKVQRHMATKFASLPNVEPYTENLLLEMPSDHELILVTDIFPIANVIHHNLVYVGYEIDESWKNKDNIVFVRKPWKDYLILEGLLQVFSHVFNIESKIDVPHFSGSHLEASSTTTLNSSFSKQQYSEVYTRCPLRILIAEDEPFNQKLLLQVLKQFGYCNVKACTDGQEAIDMVKEADKSANQFDVIFMDMQMPEVDGCSASRIIRQGKYTPHIIAMTANAFAEDKEKCLASGMCDYASKPVKWEVLEEKLVNAFEVISGRKRCTCRSA